MNELKAVYAYTLDEIEVVCGRAEGDEYYLKSEADKVISDLEDKLQAANEQVENIINSASSIMLFQDRVNDNKCTELRHHKYKRCLTMAKWCDDAARLATWDADYHRCGWYNKWMQHWLKIAEKFKPSKE